MDQLVLPDPEFVTDNLTSTQMLHLGIEAVMGKDKELASRVSVESLGLANSPDTLRSVESAGLFQAIGELTGRYVERVELGELE